MRSFYLAATVALAAASAHAQNGQSDQAHTPQAAVGFEVTGSTHQISVYPANPNDAYPHDALLAGEGGRTDLSCDWADGGKITACQVTADQTSGPGFGDAAVNLLQTNGAVYDPGRPADRFKAGKGLKVAVLWRVLPPPCAMIDATMQSDVVECADFTGVQMIADMYPADAADQNIEGTATADCTVADESGHVTCNVADEQPPKYGFGAVTVRVLGKYLTVRAKQPGTAITGATFHVTMVFKPS